MMITRLFSIFTVALRVWLQFQFKSILPEVCYSRLASIGTPLLSLRRQKLLASLILIGLSKTVIIGCPSHICSSGRRHG